MLDQISTGTITVGPEASKAVQDILTQRNLEGYALRVYVSGGGCSGVQFGMALDNNFREVDTTFDAEGIKLVVDDVSIDYLRGASIDFVNDPQHGAGFIVNNPNMKSHEGDACACGGSCACNN